MSGFTFDLFWAVLLKMSVFYLWPFLGRPLKDVRVLLHPKFSSILGPTVLFQLLEALFWPKRRPKMLKFYPTQNFGHFWTTLLRMFGFTPYWILAILGSPSEGFWSQMCAWRAKAFVNFTRWIVSACLSSSVKSMKNSPAPCPGIRNPIVVCLMNCTQQVRGARDWCHVKQRVCTVLSCNSCFFNMATALLSPSFLDLFC